MLTHQQMFDTVLEKLTRQGVASVATMDNETQCAYRGDRGHKCAAGWLADPCVTDLSVFPNPLTC